MEEFKEVDIVTLDNKDYIVLGICNGKNNYVYLSNELDSEDFLVQKTIIENGQEFFVNLDSSEEFDEAMDLFEKEKKNLL